MQVAIFAVLIIPQIYPFCINHQPINVSTQCARAHDDITVCRNDNDVTLECEQKSQDGFSFRRFCTLLVLYLILNAQSHYNSW